jgi:hypothetical protein
MRAIKNKVVICPECHRARVGMLARGRFIVSLKVVSKAKAVAMLLAGADKLLLNCLECRPFEECTSDAKFYSYLSRGRLGPKPSQEEVRQYCRRLQ